MVSDCLSRWAAHHLSTTWCVPAGSMSPPNVTHLQISRLSSSQFLFNYFFISSWITYFISSLITYFISFINLYTLILVYTCTNWSITKNYNHIMIFNSLNWLWMLFHKYFKIKRYKFSMWLFYDKLLKLSDMEIKQLIKLSWFKQVLVSKKK